MNTILGELGKSAKFIETLNKIENKIFYRKSSLIF